MSDIDAARSVRELSESERSEAMLLAAAHEALTTGCSGPWNDLTNPVCAAKLLAAANYLRAARSIGLTLALRSPLDDRPFEAIARELVELEEEEWGLDGDDRP